MGGLTRRELLRRGGGLIGGAAALSALPASARTALASVAPAGCSLTDIEHVVILLQENRSFDHYFGTLSGVAGFSDPHAQVDPVTGRSVFDQFDPALLDGTGGSLLPWRLDPRTTAAQCLIDVGHDWATQHLSIAGGANNAWLTAHIPFDSITDLAEGDYVALLDGGYRTMSYFTRDDLPFHYALADGFTVCDRYFCSVLGPTNPNRLMMMTGTIDPEGLHGGPDVNNLKLSGLSWTTYPERLQAAGIDWYLYREADDYQESQLDHFVQYQDPSTELHRRGLSIIPNGKLATKLRHDVVSGNLPQVSWIVGPEYTTEHPKQSPAVGAHFLAGILEALTADPKVWAKTALILTYDENGGFFDHVTPPMAPPGTPGEYITGQGLANTPEALPFTGPIGLGPRVPAMVISPFSRGGRVCSDTFDHTSILRFLEQRFGVEEPNISAWRRATCGDLTTAFSFGAPSDLTVPALPDTAAMVAAAADQCRTLPPPKIPREQSMPKQEPGTRPRSTGLTCASAGSQVLGARQAAVASGGASSTAASTSTTAAPGATRERIALPRTGGANLSGLAALAAAGALATHRLRQRTTPAPDR